jgi:retron-type reverse transcriptase
MNNNAAAIPLFEDIFSFQNLFYSFKDFEKGKKHKPDVAEFKSRLVENLMTLHADMMEGRYRHSGYVHFKISDPKPRDIHKARVVDRVVHHALYRALYPYFDVRFIFDSYSCRVNKGTYKAIEKFQGMMATESRNNSRCMWVLKCDIRKCFATIDHSILKKLLQKHIECPRLFAVVCSVIDSFDSGSRGKGIPLGNLTSQLFINVYLHTFDTWIKRVVGVKNYIRYADDFVVLCYEKTFLESLLVCVHDFLRKELVFEIHPDKVCIQTITSGIDFLGWVHFYTHSVLRAKTRKRMFKKLSIIRERSVLASYVGLLSHGNAYKLQQKIQTMVE